MRPTLHFHIVFLLLVFAAHTSLPGCAQKHDSAGKRSGLLHGPDAGGATDVARAKADLPYLMRLLSASPAQTTQRLGAFRARGHQRMRVHQGDDTLEELGETTTVNHAASGNYYALYENTRGYGRESYFSRARNLLWLRPRYGKFHRRAPTRPDEPAEVLSDALSAFAAALELALPALRVVDQGMAAYKERPARHLRLALGTPNPAAAVARGPSDTTRAWRHTFVPKVLDGEIWIDEATGAVLAARLRLTGNVTRTLAASPGDTPLQDDVKLALDVSQDLFDVGGDVTVDLPSDEMSADTPVRTRHIQERDELLRGLATPLRPLPASPEGQAP